MSKSKYRVIRERAILLAGISFMANELETFREKHDMTESELLAFDDVRRVAQLITRISNTILGNMEYPITIKFMEACVLEVNQERDKAIEEGKEKPATHIDLVVGYSLLGLYKEEFKGKRVGRGLIDMPTLNEIFFQIEKADYQPKANIHSMKMADRLWDKIMNSSVKEKVE